MKEYKRLTVRDKNNGKPFIPYKDYRTDKKINGYDDGYFDLLNRLAELEDKIENGTLIELPCNIGDTVWEIFYSKYEERILELEVTQIVMLEKISYRCKTKTRCLYSYGWVKNEDFGKTVFLTKAEAEAKLKELKEV